MEAETAVSLITVLIAVIGVVVSVLTAANAAKKDAFEQLEKVVKQLNCRIDDLETENEDLRMWANKLVGQLVEAKITPHSYIPRRKRKHESES